MPPLRLKEALKDDIKRAALKKQLMTYPGATEESTEQDLWAYEMRVAEKAGMIERRYSNALAEYALDRKGYPRPPGWQSVFFYPDSYQPRYRYVFLTAVAAAYFFFIR